MMQIHHEGIRLGDSRGRSCYHGLGIESSGSKYLADRCSHVRDSELVGLEHRNSRDHSEQLDPTYDQVLTLFSNVCCIDQRKGYMVVRRPVVVGEVQRF